jgi:hypothetical protein
MGVQGDHVSIGEIRRKRSHEEVRLIVGHMSFSRHQLSE